MFARGFNKAVFMHDPISFGSFWGLANVKDESFLDTYFTSI
jgi:hypothetical protein